MLRYLRLFTFVLVLASSAHWRCPGLHLYLYQLRSSLVSSLPGGTALQGGAYRLSAIAGQPVIGESSAEGSYSLDAGYSELSVPPPNPDASQVYLPFIRR